MTSAEFKAAVEALLDAGAVAPFEAARDALLADLKASGFSQAESVDLLNQASDTVLKERATAALAPKATERAAKLAALRAAGLVK